MYKRSKSISKLKTKINKKSRISRVKSVSNISNTNLFDIDNKDIEIIKHKDDPENLSDPEAIVFRIKTTKYNASILLYVPKLYKPSSTKPLIIGGIYKNYGKEFNISKKNNGAPKGLVRKLLCYALVYLNNKKLITFKTKIRLEADNDILITKVYQPMGLKVINKYRKDNGGMMEATTQEILKWCSKTYI